jgi:hypothetical protein
MDSFELVSDDSITWKVVGIKNGMEVCTMAYCNEFTQALELIQELGGNIAKDRHLLPQRSQSDI